MCIFYKSLNSHNYKKLLNTVLKKVMQKNLLDKDFIQYRRSLLIYSGKFNVSFEEREEIVNDSILAALKSFDHDKGSFESYCKIILKNKIFNFKRDNKDLFLLVAIDDDDEILKADEISYEEKEKNKLAVIFINKLKNTLETEELKFYNSIYESCDKNEKINISKVSKNLNIEPQKGWDIFRRIQTKAASLYKYMISNGEEDFNERFELPVIFENISLYSNVDSKADFKDKELMLKEYEDAFEGLNDFLSEFSDLQIELINRIYNR